MSQVETSVWRDGLQLMAFNCYNCCQTIGLPQWMHVGRTKISLCHCSHHRDNLRDNFAAGRQAGDAEACQGAMQLSITVKRMFACPLRTCPLPGQTYSQRHEQIQPSEDINHAGQALTVTCLCTMLVTLLVRSQQCSENWHTTSAGALGCGLFRCWYCIYCASVIQTICTWRSPRLSTNFLGT